MSIPSSSVHGSSLKRLEEGVDVEQVKGNRCATNPGGYAYSFRILVTAFPEAVSI
jgi:hypothetical protein